MSTVVGSLTYVEIECGSCGLPFAFSEAFVTARKKDHRTWYCPNGCPRHYPGETREERLSRQLRAARSRATHLGDQLESTRRSKAAIKGHLTRLRRRIADGICPECDEQFPDVHAHMQAEHPEFAERMAEREREVSQ